MPRTARQLSNIPPVPRWSYETAAREFNCSPVTLKKRLTMAAIEPGKDLCYSTADITAALFGDLHSARIAKTQNEAEHVALQNAILKREYHPASECSQILTNAFVVMKQAIIGAALPEHLQNSLLIHLRELGEVDWLKL